MTAPLYPSPSLYPSTTLYPSAPAVAVAFPSLPQSSQDLYRAAMRNGSYALTYTVDVTRGGSVVATGLTPVGGTTTDTTAPGVRRVLNLDLAPSPGLFDLLSPIGTTLKLTAHIRYQDRSTFDVSMGVFDVDNERLTEGSGGLSLTAPDKWVRVQRARFLRPQLSSWSAGMSVKEQIAFLIRGALGASEPVNITATSNARVGVMTWEKDRDQAILDLAKSIGAWVYFDRQGVATIADIPTGDGAASWLIDSGQAGVLTELSRERSRANTYNVVVVESSAATDATFSTQIVHDSNPASPTYAGIDPVNRPETAGPFGIVPYYFDTPLPLDAPAANYTGRTILARVTGLASQVSLSQSHNPALDAFDTLDVLAPRERYDLPRTLERHVADTVTHPLTVDGTQSIDGRSTRMDDYS